MSFSPAIDNTDPSFKETDPTADPTDGGLRKFKQGKLPWSQPSWLFLNSSVHVVTSILEVLVIIMTVYWGAFSQNSNFFASVQVDFDPTDQIVRTFFVTTSLYQVQYIDSF